MAYSRDQPRALVPHASRSLGRLGQLAGETDELAGAEGSPALELAQLAVSAWVGSLLLRLMGVS